MDIRTLRYFVEVVRQQSFTRAAEKMFVTQPTISKMLRNLEDELGCTLLLREGRRLVLTDTGRAVFDRGVTILGEFRQLKNELADINNLNKGVLRLGIPPMVGTMMAEPIAEYRRQYPGIELKIAEFGGMKVQQAVMDNELDLAITALTSTPDENLESLAFSSHPMCVLVPRSEAWLSRSSMTLEELEEWPLLIYNEDFALSHQMDQLFAERQLSPRIAVRSGQWDFLAAMVQANVGIAILPEPICRRLDNTNLLWLPLHSPLRWQLGMIWRRDSYLSQSTRAWIRCCKSFWPVEP